VSSIFLFPKHKLDCHAAFAGTLISLALNCLPIEKDALNTGFYHKDSGEFGQILLDTEMLHLLNHADKYRTVFHIVEF
jgi:hypothetical protein